MNKKLYFLLLPMFAVLILFGSCSDEKNPYKEVSPEWKAWNKHVYDSIGELAKDGVDGWQKRESHTHAGYFYYRPSDSLKVVGTRITKTGTPQVNDTIKCRYEGSILLENGKPYIFDSTEKGNLAKPYESALIYPGLIAGWIDFMTMDDMKIGEEFEVCLPYTLAYGEYGNGGIPGYSTLFFIVRLLDVKPVNKTEWEEWQKNP